MNLSNGFLTIIDIQKGSGDELIDHLVIILLKSEDESIITDMKTSVAAVEYTLINTNKISLD